jgi:RNA polymerase sigma-70 factor (ECF subfamily)
VDSTAYSQRFDQLFRAHYARVLSYARRRTSPSVADDVVAETFLTAWRRLDDIPRDELPWLLGVARRVIANQHRREATQQRIRHRVAREPVDEAGSASLPDPDLPRALAELSDRDRELLTLVAWDGLSAAEAARVVGCSPATARVRLHRARRRLAAKLSASTGRSLPWKATDPTF